MNVRSLARSWLVVLLTGVVALQSSRGPAAEAVSRTAESEARLRRDVVFLASDDCEGRGVTTKGIHKAADYIAGEFTKAGLKPGGPDGSWFQPFTIPGAVQEAPATLELKGPRGQIVELKQGVHFHAMGLGATGSVNGLPAVFVGHGIASDAPKFDDYASLDVADKVAIALRDTPRQNVNEKDSAFAGGPRRRQLASFSEKISAAEKHHAAALLVVNDATTAASGDDLLDFNYTALSRSPAKIPVFHVRRSVLEAMLPGGADELRGVEEDVDRDLKPRGKPLAGWTVSLRVKMKRDKVALKNVVGVLDGQGPLARETVVIGAHYDHLGYGGTSSMANLKKMTIHHGADDNGSGTTTMMELARRFAATPGPRRRMVFVAFSGEELGLFGSDYYVKHPIFPLDQTVGMFNLDMVGRLRVDDKTKKEKLLIEGSGTAKTFDALLESTNKKYDFKLSKKPSGFGPSDHASFYGAKVPVLFCWTDYHEDYHAPGDTADKINVAGMRKIADFAEEIVAHLVADEKRPEYVEIKSPFTGSRSSDGPRLGIRPGYSDEEDKGVLLEGVSDGGPAAKAGLKSGDRIVEMAGKPVKNLETYMKIMGDQKKGSALEIVILRDGKRLPVKVSLE